MYIIQFLMCITIERLALSQAETFNVAVLMVNHSTSNRFDVQHIGPAIDIAVETCRAEYNITLRMLEGYYDHECSEIQSLGKAVDLCKEHDITAFLGPACSDDLQVVGCLAAYRKIPILTGLGDVLKDREELFTLIRLSYDLKDKAQAILSFLKNFGWKYIGIVYREHDVYYDTLAELFFDLARVQGFEITCQQTYVRARNKTVLSDLERILKTLKSCARVIVILGGDREVRKMMLLAENLGMTRNGDYVFLYPELFQNEAKGNLSWSRGSESGEVKMRIKKAYESLLIVSINQPYSDAYINFSENVKKIAFEKYDFEYEETTVNYFTASFHDALVMLCESIQEVLLSGGDPRNGLVLSSTLKNRSFNGVTGRVTVNAHGDRIADFALLSQTDTESGNFEVVRQHYVASKNHVETGEIKWKGGRIPVDKPKCGFDGQDISCIKKGFPLMEVSFVVTCVLIVMLLAAGIITYRKIKLENALQNMSWRVKWDDIIFPKDPRTSWMMSRLSISSAMSAKMEKGWVSWSPKYDSLYLDNPVTGPDYHYLNVLTGTYKGNIVAVKRLVKQKKIELTRDVRMELKKVREAQHQNIAAFVGACIDPPNVAVLMEYCPKGSLQDVLKNDSLELDWTFRYSLINDIIKGMSYLHSSELGTHGRLRSTNCLVDSRFVLKLSDFGLPSLRSNESYGISDTREQKKLLWKAPELLRLDKCSSQGTQKGDVYSFGIILQEISVRDEPFYPYHETMAISDIIDSVRKCCDPVFRPVLPEDCCSKEMMNLMKLCWSEEPEQRPTFGAIKAEMRAISKTQNGDVNIMDNLLSRMEQYANNLESLVEQRTAAFLEEKKRSEELLYQVLPRSVAEQLKRGKSVDPEYFDSVTIYFSDVVGFTNMCSSSTPIQVVDFLNDLYTCFDSIISDFDVYKVETIGDAYMVVSGLPERNGFRHAEEIARMALTLLASVDTFRIRHKPDEKLKLRIGLHTGPCCAGVVGQKMPRYCLFGDTVNTASRMESTGEPLKIHVSGCTKCVLDQFGSFILVPREEIEVKGKGKMQTYWLTEEISQCPSAKRQ